MPEFMPVFMEILGRMGMDTPEALDLFNVNQEAFFAEFSVRGELLSRLSKAGDKGATLPPYRGTPLRLT